MSEKNLLEIRNLDISFGGVHAVNHLSFDVVEGECLGLIGPNGSGKSTCVNIISGLYKPDGGEILFQGENVLKLTPMDRAFKGIGRTFQSPKAFEGLNVLDRSTRHRCCTISTKATHSGRRTRSCLLPDWNRWR